MPESGCDLLKQDLSGLILNNDVDHAEVGLLLEHQPTLNAADHAVSIIDAIDQHRRDREAHRRALSIEIGDRIAVIPARTA